MNLFLRLLALSLATGLGLSAALPRVPLPGNGGWDYLTADAAARRLYVTHQDRVHVLDLDTLALLGEIGAGAGVHGVALAPELGRGFVSNGLDATITVFDLATRAILGRWPTGGRKPDAILYDAASRRLFSFNGETDNATAFDAATGRIVGTVALGGAPEFAVTDEAGGIYVNIEDRGETLRFDARTLAVTARWPLAPAHTPTGLALDREHHRLFVGCRSQQLVVLQADTGAVIASLPIGRGVDAVSYDSSRNQVWVSNADGTLNAFHQAGPDRYEPLRTVATASGARTHALDAKTGRIFLATAEYLPTPPAAPGQPRVRPAIKPGTFGVLIVQP